MKKNILILLVFAAILLGCGNKKTNEAAAKDNLAPAAKSAPQAAGSSGAIDVRENMFITQLNDINLNYKTYLGRTVKIQGMFKKLHWDGKSSYFVYRRTPGCCGDDGEIGFELSWDQNYQGSIAGPDGNTYPNSNDWVEVSGELKSYEKSGFPFLYLALAELNVLGERGAEFVSR